MITQEEAEIYKRFYEQVINRPKNVHCGAKIDYIKSRILDVQEAISSADKKLQNIDTVNANAEVIQFKLPNGLWGEATVSGVLHDLRLPEFKDPIVLTPPETLIDELSRNEQSSLDLKS